MTDTTKSIQKSALRFLSGTLLSRLTGMMRDIAMAFAFGTESTLAGFMVAFRFAHLARRLFGEGSLQNTFIPHFEELKTTNPPRAFAFFRDLSASIALILIGFAILGGIFLYLVYLGPFGTEVKQIALFTGLMLPSLVFISLYGLNSALLACEKLYFISSFAPAAFNLIWIAGALLLSGLPIQTAMTGLSIAVIIGCFAQMAATVPSTLKILPKHQFFSKTTPFSEDVKTLFKPLLLANFGVAASQINNALDPLFALFANAEAPAWLWFAIRVQQLPLALLGIALANALTPPIARAIKSNSLSQFHHFFEFAKQKTVAFTFLISSGIFITAPTCINLLFGRGHFGMESVEGTAKALLGYGIGLFPMAYILILAPALFAFGDYKTPTKGAVYSMLFSIACNIFFIFFLQAGGESVALATSLAAFGNAYYLHRSLKQKAPHNGSIFPTLLKTSLISLIAVSSVILTDLFLLGFIPAFDLIQGTPLQLSQNLLSQTTIFLSESAVFFSSAAIAAYFLNAREFFDFN